MRSSAWSVAILACALGCDRAPEGGRESARTLELSPQGTRVVGVVVPAVTAEDAPPVATGTPAPRVTTPHAVAAAAILDPAEAVEPACVPHWDGSAHADLDKCVAGDGDGCTGIGDHYRAGCDAYSSIKWYLRGCRLGSSGACLALGELGERTSVAE